MATIYSRLDGEAIEMSKELLDYACKTMEFNALFSRTPLPAPQVTMPAKPALALPSPKPEDKPLNPQPGMDWSDLIG